MRKNQRKQKRIHAIPLRETQGWKDRVNNLRRQLRSLGFTEEEIEMGVTMAEKQAMGMLRETTKRRAK